jgi:hypothetical protein
MQDGRTYIVSVTTVVDAWPVVTVCVTVIGITVVVAGRVLVDGMVVVTKQVGRGIGYFFVQNDCAGACFESGAKSAYGSLVQHGAVALAPRMSSVSAKTVRTKEDMAGE